MTKSEIFAAIAAGRLEVQGRPGHWWKVRYNGKPRDFPDGRYEIPCRAGLKLFFDLTEHDIPLDPMKFRVKR